MDTDRIEEAKSHLGAAIAQALPSDDQIIMEHVRAAHELLRQEAHARRATREADSDVAAAVRLQTDMGRMIRKAFGL